MKYKKFKIQVLIIFIIIFLFVFISRVKISNNSFDEQKILQVDLRVDMTNRSSASDNSIDSYKDDRQKYDENSKLKKLIDSQIDNEMRKLLNARLMQSGILKKDENANGVIFTTSGPASIVIKLIDEKGRVILYDISEPLPIKKDEG